MLLCVFMLRLLWASYCELILLGKIILFPIFLMLLIGFVAFGIGETLLIDVWVFLFVLFSKELEVKDVIWQFWRE